MNFKRLVLIIATLFYGSSHLTFAIDLHGSIFSHDPATLIKDGDTYWHFYTAPGVGAAYSKDRINWTSSSNHIFQPGTNWKTNYPAWTITYFGSGTTANTDGNIWAPDIIYMNGAYYLYYSCSSFGEPRSAIGCVKSTSLNSPNWVDMGMVVSSQTSTDFNAIDPGLFKDDDGKVYMVYGSYSAGIGIVDIDTVTGLATSAVQYLAGESGRSYEGASMFKEDGYYYLVINRGSCCNGVSSTYFIIAGRSANVKGPYEDFRTLLPNKDGKYIGPGHFSLYRDPCGANYATIHYYDGNAGGAARYDILRVQMEDGWPVLYRNFSFDDCSPIINPSTLMSISITKPTADSVYEKNQSINVVAEASHTEDKIMKVTFYVNDQQVAEDFTEPYSYQIPGLEEGINSIYATVTDSNDLSLNSETVYIQVGLHAAFQENEEGYCGITNDAGSVDSDHLDYTGEGFINTDNVTGARVNWSVNFAETGTYTIQFRYSATSARPGKVTVNGKNIGTLDFPLTASWDVWEFDGINYTVSETGPAYISVIATASEGLPNIDYMSITPLESTKRTVASECDPSYVTEMTGISDQFFLYPQPAKDIICIKSEKNLQHISIYRADGTKIKTINNINSKYYEISSSDLGEIGLFIMQITIENMMYTRKFTVIK